MLNEVVKRTVCDELVKKVKAIQAVDAGNLVKKLTMTQKLVKLKKKLLIMVIVINILVLKNLMT